MQQKKMQRAGQKILLVFLQKKRLFVICVTNDRLYVLMDNSLKARSKQMKRYKIPLALLIISCDS